MPSTRQFRYLGLVVLVALVGCKQEDEMIVGPEQKPDYAKPLPPGENALVKLTDPSQFPDFSEGFLRRRNLELATRYSLDYLGKPSSHQFFPLGDVTHERAVASVKTFIDVLHSVQSGEELDAMIKDLFDIYQSRGYDDNGIVLFTGYYRPIFDARLEPDGEFRCPLYRRPDDLALDPVTGVYGRQGGGAYYTRAEIENGVLAARGLELCYLRKPFEAYIVTVQGSARLRLEDGTYFDIGYHGDNGHDYVSVGQHLVDKGLLAPEELSLQGLIRFFDEHPGHLDVLGINNRYVFFTPRHGGPYGSLNVPVTPFRSIATDKQVYPRACVAFMRTKVPARRPDGSVSDHRYSGFALDQDTGGAIRAAGRCDFFLGTGPEMGELAGRVLSEGQLYYVFLKSEYLNSTAAASPAAPAGPGAEPEP